MGISISNLISYDIVVSITVASIVLLVVWFIMRGYKNFCEHHKKLFKQPPPEEDCPICFLRLPTMLTGRKYYSCCGQTICSGCSYAPVYDNQGNKVDNQKCPFCRRPTPHTVEEILNRLNKRVEVDDPIAIYNLGNYYSRGEGACGFPQDYSKALELWHRAGELGCTEAYCSIGYSYLRGEGVKVDKNKARHYFDSAAMMGDVVSRYSLGFSEDSKGNMDRALRHFLIGVKSGHIDSLNGIQKLYSNGHATKDDYKKALQLYQAYLDEIKSAQRDTAAAANKRYRYY